jgi:AraC-like DNA-binding protein
MRELGSGVIATTIGLGSWHGSPAPMARPHRHNEIEMNFLENGSMTYLHGGVQITVPAQRFALFWASVPHQLIVTDDSPRCHWVTLPLAWFLQWKLPGQLTRQIMDGKIVIESDAGRAPQDLGLMKQWQADMKTTEAERRDTFLLELEARLRRLALSTTTPAAPVAQANDKKSMAALTRGGLGKVEEMAQFIAVNHGRHLRVAEIAEAVNLHPNYAMSLFRKTFGISLVDYTTQHRISHAQRLLVTTDAKILDIALESGFGSLSRFYASFSAACGQSPKEYRESLKVGREAKA